jgi:hypothetical protein
MWIDLETKKVVNTHSEIRAMRPNWSGPDVITDEMISELGFATVLQVQPQFDPLSQVASELAPRLVEDVWIQQWDIIDLSDVQIALNFNKAVQDKNAEINAARLKANATSFTYMGKEIAVDTVSFNDIISTNGYVALFGGFSAGWPGGWKTIDNSYVPIATADDWKSFYTAMYTQGTTNFGKAQALKKKLSEATTLEEINNISWE